MVLICVYYTLAFHPVVQFIKEKCFIWEFSDIHIKHTPPLKLFVLLQLRWELT